MFFSCGKLRFFDAITQTSQMSRLVFNNICMYVCILTWRINLSAVADPIILCMRRMSGGIVEWQFSKRIAFHVNCELTRNISTLKHVLILTSAMMMTSLYENPRILWSLFSRLPILVSWHLYNCTLLCNNMWYKHGWTYLISKII